MPSPWVTRALENDLPAQAFAGLAAEERAEPFWPDYTWDEVFDAADEIGDFDNPLIACDCEECDPCP